MYKNWSCINIFYKFVLSNLKYVGKWKKKLKGC
jgi:hypothetical protein